METRRVNGRKILLAEDSLMSAVHLESILRSLNFKVDIVRNGEEAIQSVRNNHYDILFLDIQMPDMGGLKAAREIRLMGHDLPILVLARHAVSKEMLTLNGVNEIILKPFSKEKLESKISQFVTK